MYLFKADGKAEIFHSQIFTSPAHPGTIFWVTDKLAIYKFSTHDLLGATNIKKPQKFKLATDAMINEIQVHPTLPLLFVA